jgi:hypothetical protein
LPSCRRRYYGSGQTIWLKINVKSQRADDFQQYVRCLILVQLRIARVDAPPARMSSHVVPPSRVRHSAPSSVPTNGTSGSSATATAGRAAEVRTAEFRRDLLQGVAAIQRPEQMIAADVIDLRGLSSTGRRRVQLKRVGPALGECCRARRSRGGCVLFHRSGSRSRSNSDHGGHRAVESVTAPYANPIFVQRTAVARAMRSRAVSPEDRRRPCSCAWHRDRHDRTGRSRT